MSAHTPSTSEIPRQLFFNTAEQRTALARQRFFEDGERPSGLVGEAVIQSWMRCCNARHRPDEGVSFDEVSRSRAHAALNRSHQLLQAAGHELSSMEASLAGIGCRVLLTDARGVIVHASEHPLLAQQHLLKLASRVGVNLAESRIGTTAPGIVIHSGQTCSVNGAEHFFDSMATLRCAAAPIRDAHGQLAGVLDVTVQNARFDFDAASVVELCATAIENRLLRAQSHDQVVLQFQAHPSLLGTPLEALAGIDSRGRVVWLNRVGARLTSAQHPGIASVEDLLGVDLDTLLHFCRQPGPQTIQLPNGLGVWVRCQLLAQDGADFQHAIALPAKIAAPVVVEQATPDGSATAALPQACAPLPPLASGSTLGSHERVVIESTLAECGGNIARAARTLGVSRGMLYRRLKQWAGSDTADTAP